MRILIIEDERRLAHVVKKGLIEDGFAADLAYDGEDGMFMAETEPYDLIILDIMLPKLDGVAICRRLRQKKHNIPVIMLTAKSNVEDKVTGLDSGADDYLTKPFSFLELKSRIHALIRRSRGESSPVLKIADLTVDPIKHTVNRNKHHIKLTPKEFAILEFLMRHKDEVVSRTMLIEHVWDYNFEGLSNVVDVFVAALRKKIDGKATFKLIHTLHGVGYKISKSV